MKNMNTNHKDIITSFVSNTVLHHVGMSWIIKTNKNLKHDMGKNNADRIKCDIWYNTNSFKKLHGKVFE